MVSTLPVESQAQMESALRSPPPATTSQDDESYRMREFLSHSAARRQTESDIERRKMREAYEASLRKSGVYVPVPISHPSVLGQSLIQSHKGKERLLGVEQHQPAPPSAPPQKQIALALKPSPPISCIHSSSDLSTPVVTPQQATSVIPTQAASTIVEEPDEVADCEPPLKEIQDDEIAVMKLPKVEIIQSPQPVSSPNLSYLYNFPPRPTSQQQQPQLQTTVEPTRQQARTVTRHQSLPTSAFSKGKLSGDVEPGYWFPEDKRFSQRVAYSDVQQSQKIVQNQQYATLLPSHVASVELTSTSPGGLHYMDYTYNESALLALKHPAYEQLLARQGAHRVELKWCSQCENVAKHRQWAWSILTTVMKEFPNFDYCHSLPSEQCSEHTQELARSTHHRTATLDCKEMYILFTPRGGATRSLKVAEASLVVAALRKVVQALPQTNVVVSLLNARNLEAKRSFFTTPKLNPFVQFTVMGDTEALASTTVPSEDKAQPSESEPRCTKDGKKLISKFATATPNPDFAVEKFAFQINNPNQAQLKMEVFNYAAGKKEFASLGWAVLSLKQLRVGEALRVTADLQDSKSGTISIVLQAEGAPFEASSSEGARVSYHVSRSGTWAYASPRTAETASEKSGGGSGRGSGSENDHQTVAHAPLPLPEPTTAE